MTLDLMCSYQIHETPEKLPSRELFSHIPSNGRTAGPLKLFFLVARNFEFKFTINRNLINYSPLGINKTLVKNGNEWEYLPYQLVRVGSKTWRDIRVSLFTALHDGSWSILTTPAPPKPPSKLQVLVEITPKCPGHWDHENLRVPPPQRHPPG